MSLKLFGLALVSPFVLLAGVAVLIHRGRKKTALLIVVVVLAALLLLFRPVCRPIEDSSLANFDPPIETRQDENFYGLKTFQQKDGSWLQCKTWIARQFFF
jgi:hypothetical protein